MDIDVLWLVLIVTPIVMAVIIVVIGVIFFRVLLPPTKKALAERHAQQEADGLARGARCLDRLRRRRRASHRG